MQNWKISGRISEKEKTEVRWTSWGPILSSNCQLNDHIHIFLLIQLQDGLRFTYFWIKEQIEKEKGQGADMSVYGSSKIVGTQAPVQLGSLRAADGKEWTKPSQPVRLVHSITRFLWFQVLPYFSSENIFIWIIFPIVRYYVVLLFFPSPINYLYFYSRWICCVYSVFLEWGLPLYCLRTIFAPFIYVSSIVVLSLF